MIEEVALPVVGVLGAVRAFAVMSSGPTIAALAVLASLRSAGRALPRWHRPRPTALLTIAALIAYLTVLRP